MRNYRNNTVDYASEQRSFTIEYERHELWNYFEDGVRDYITYDLIGETECLDEIIDCDILVDESKVTFMVTANIEVPIPREIKPTEELTTLDRLKRIASDEAIRTDDDVKALRDAIAFIEAYATAKELFE